MQPMPEDWDRAVAVVAHPDDLEYGVASAVARWTGQGKQVSYVLATRGEAGIAGLAPEQVGPLRVEEERRSAAVVGVTAIEFLDHQDGLVEYGIALRRDLAAAFRRLNPQVVIGMSFDLTWGEDGPVNHADHRAVGLATLDACRDAANEWVFPDAGPPCPEIRDAYIAGTGTPTHFADVTGTIEAGVASLREHRAYIEGLGREFDPDEFLKNMAGYIGAGRGLRVRGQLPPLPDGLGAAGGQAGRARAATWPASDSAAVSRLSTARCGTGGSAPSRMLAQYCSNSASLASSRASPRAMRRRRRVASSDLTQTRRTVPPPSSAVQACQRAASWICAVNGPESSTGQPWERISRAVAVIPAYS